MSCCSHACSIACHFDHLIAKRDLERYRRNGPDKSTKRLIDAIASAGVSGATVLDVGAGIGVVAHELLASGAATATLVDASSAYGEAARSEAERRGNTARIEVQQGDFVALAEQLPAADIVTLDRVICCYPDMERLVGASVQRARRLYGAVYPRGSWWVRLMIAIENAVRRMKGNDFRAFVHAPRAIDAAIRDHGFTPRSIQRSAVWITALYERSPAGS